MDFKLTKRRISKTRNPTAKQTSKFKLEPLEAFEFNGALAGPS